ncbi:hypothetical protein EON63_15465 [archaeon]|nr:MAG: hypothetical protein EON63_15465 [archaeon]
MLYLKFTMRFNAYSHTYTTTHTPSLYTPYMKHYTHPHIVLMITMHCAPHTILYPQYMIHTQSNRTPYHACLHHIVLLLLHHKCTTSIHTPYTHHTYTIYHF